MVYALKLSTKIVKPKNKTLGFFETKDHIKIHDGIMLKENNPRSFEFSHVFYVLLVSTCLRMGFVML
jgi:hypothetical protein